jgi:hypothetical protein
MRPIAAALAGSGAALGASLVIWPLYVLVMNLAVVRDVSLPGAATEILWGIPYGAVAGVAAARIAGLASDRDWPLTAFGSWLIWTCVLAMLLGVGLVPLVFVATAMLVALGTTTVIAARLRPRARLRLRVAPSLVRAGLAGLGGFSVFVTAYVLVIVAATRSRPSGVGFAEWRRYMDGVDMLGATALALGLGATLALAIVRSERRTVGVLVSLLAFGVLFLASAPVLGFFSSCYAGEVLRIFGWLVSPIC